MEGLEGPRVRAGSRRCRGRAGPRPLGRRARSSGAQREQRVLDAQPPGPLEEDGQSPPRGGRRPVSSPDTHRALVKTDLRAAGGRLRSRPRARPEHRECSSRAGDPLGGAARRQGRRLHASALAPRSPRSRGRLGPHSRPVRSEGAMRPRAVLRPVGVLPPQLVRVGLATLLGRVDPVDRGRVDREPLLARERRLPRARPRARPRPLVQPGLLHAPWTVAGRPSARPRLRSARCAVREPLSVCRGSSAIAARVRVGRVSGRQLR